jgi:hypothetical protein
MNDTRQIQARGLSVVSDIIQVALKCGWQEFGSINDNGIDGILIERKRGSDTGTFYYLQIKCGDGYLKKSKKRDGYLEINAGKEYITRHRKRWEIIKDPVLLVYVEFSTKKAWWVDLKSDKSYCPDENNSLILIPKNQRFGQHSLGDLRKLRSFYDIDRTYNIIHLGKNDNLQDTFTKSSKVAAKNFYASWSKSNLSERQNKIIGEITISRVGWRHISLIKRKKENILQSYKLIGAAKRIILENSTPLILRSNSSLDSEYLIVKEDIGLRSRVIFSSRQESVVQVVLRRKKMIDVQNGKIISSQTWFYSVHELRRGKKMC